MKYKPVYLVFTIKSVGVEEEDCGIGGQGSLDLGFREEAKIVESFDGPELRNEKCNAPYDHIQR